MDFSRLDTSNPFHYMMVEQADAIADIFSLAGQHAGAPLIFSVGKWQHHQIFVPHIVEDKIHRDRNPLILGGHLMAEAEAAGFKDDVRFKTSLFASLCNHMIDFKFAAFDIKLLTTQIINGHIGFFAQRVLAIDQQFDLKSFQFGDII